MDILAQTPDTRAGRETEWLWSRMLAIARGSQPFDAKELAEHFAPSVFDQISADQLVAHFVQLAPTMALVTQLVEEVSSDQRYTALLALPNYWLRYTCQAQADEPQLLIEAGYSFALDPVRYSDQRVQGNGREVRIRDFGGKGPLMLLLHGAGNDLTSWEALVPCLEGFHVIAQDLPGHGLSPLKAFTSDDALADTDVVVAELKQGPPIVVGHSLGGYIGLRYAATRKCGGWIGLDGPFALDYPWDSDDAELPEIINQIGREIRAIDVASNIAAMSCPAMLLLCAIAASPIEELLVISRQELAEHVAQYHAKIRIEWVPTGHDMILFHQPQITGAAIRGFLYQFQ
jgi:pimeloyl-ACP methyl ester carboxylesterase